MILHRNDGGGQGDKLLELVAFAYHLLWIIIPWLKRPSVLVLVAIGVIAG